MVKLNRTEFKTLRKHHKGLLRRYEGPFEIVEKVGLSSRAPMAVTASYDKDIEAIIDKRVVRSSGKKPSTEYLVVWKGLPAREATWEKERDLWEFRDQVQAYLVSTCAEDIATIGGGECHNPLKRPQFSDQDNQR
ncbi:unnamed protein product [Withania somnifera]